MKQVKLAGPSRGRSVRPRGYIESVGSEDLEVLLAFNNGTYESIALTAWMAGNPPQLLATNFQVPESVFAAFPKQANAIP
jgi:oxalate decarboxylase